MPKGQAKPHPPLSVKEAAALPQAIRDNNAGKPINRLLLADAMGLKPSGDDLRNLITASARYGFTDGNYSSETIAMTERGLKLTKPRSDDEQLSAMREGVRTIPIFEKLLAHYSGNKLPELKFLVNTLERPPFSLSSADAGPCADVFVKSGKDVGFIRPISGSLRVLLDAGPPVEVAAEEQAAGEPREGTTDDAVDEHEQIPSVESAPPPVLVQRDGGVPAARETPLQLFVAHGRKQGPVDQLTKILREFGIPFVVAETEPHAGRPISQKVRDLMDACTAGVYLFTADEKFTDEKANVVWRPRENVVYELGAGSYKYGTKIVVFKEKEVTFPTDYQSLGYIEFDEGQLQAKTLELIRELVALKALRWTPGQ